MSEKNWDMPDFESFPEAPVPEFPANISFFEPMEMYMGVEVLKTTTQQNLDKILEYEQECGDTLTSELQALLTTAKVQRTKFLAWLDTVPSDHVYVALYPTQETILLEK